jgi:hypothetical protein
MSAAGRWTTQTPCGPSATSWPTRCPRSARSSSAWARRSPREVTEPSTSAEPPTRCGLASRGSASWATRTSGQPTHPDAPSLIADQFHPHVWQAASARWDTGQCRVAVGQATVSLSAHIAARSRRVRTYPGSGPRRRKQQVELGERPRTGGRPRAARADAHRGLPRGKPNRDLQPLQRRSTLQALTCRGPCRPGRTSQRWWKAPSPGSSGRLWGRLRGIVPNLFTPRCGTSPVRAVAVVVAVLALDLLAACLGQRR